MTSTTQVDVWRGRVLDGAIAATVFAVPLAFSEAMRTFGAAKLAALEVGIAIALVLAGFVGGWRTLPRAAIAAGGVIAVACVMRPDAEGIAGAGYLAALVSVAAITAWRSEGWPDRRVLQCIGVPFVLGLGLSLAQSFGYGVMPATRMSFGDAHGVAVGTIGNPVENTWWLVLAVAMLYGLVSRRTIGLAIVLVAIVIVVDRARASALVAGVAIAVVVLRDEKGWLRWAAVGLACAAVVGFVVWGGMAAIQGRGVLLGIGARMVFAARGVPQGPGAFARDFEEAQREHLAANPGDAAWGSILDHAHCDAIELAYELGVIGVAAIVWLVITIVRRVRSDPTPRRRAAATTLAIAASLGVVGYPLFSAAPAVLVAVAVGFALAPARDEGPAAPDARLQAAMRVLAVGLGVGLLVLGLRQATSELAITRSLVAHAENDDRRGLEAARLAVVRFGSADAWFYLGNFEQRAGDCTRASAAWTRSAELRPRDALRKNLERCAETANGAPPR